MESKQVHHAFLEAKKALLASTSGLESKRADLSIKKVATRQVALNHALWLYEEGVKRLVVGNLEEAILMLSFLQGVLWTYGIASLEEIQSTNTKPVP